jgi:hypothetical protein
MGVAKVAVRGEIIPLALGVPRQRVIKPARINEPRLLLLRIEEKNCNKSEA